MATVRRAAANNGGHSALINYFMEGAIPAGTGANGWVLMDNPAEDISYDLTMHETFVEISKT